MSEHETIRQVIAELREESRELARRSRLRDYVYLAVGVFLAGYLTWGYLRIRPYTDPIFVADTLVELGESQIPGLMDGLTSQVTSGAPSIIQAAEDQLEGTLTSLRQQLQQSIGDGMGEAISNVMVDHDAPIMAKLKAHPELALQAIESPAGVDAFQAMIRESDHLGGGKVKNKLVRDSLQELTVIRDRVRRLQQNRGLNELDKAERRLLVSVLAHVPMPPPEAAGKVIR